MLKICFLFLFSIPLNSFCQEAPLNIAKKALASGKSISEVLMDPQFDSIRPETAFRELIRQNAKQNVASIASPKEPGTETIIRGVINNLKGQPLSSHLVYIYQTDTKGWYGKDRVHFQMMEGDRKHARLFGYLVTDTQGTFEIHTIQPHGYPGSDLPAHIHLEVFDNNNALLITELLFDDDDRLKGAVRSRSEGEGFYISKPQTESGKKVYNYLIKLNR